VYELVFGNAWMLRMTSVNPPDVMEYRRALKELEDWTAGRTFKDPDKGATMHIVAAIALLNSHDTTAAARAAKGGLDCHPKDAKVLSTLKALEMAARGGQGSGTGFVVAADGHLLTNHHVIDGAARLLVQLPNRKDPVEAKVVDKDAQRDMALLKIDPPSGVRLQPLPVATTPLRRGAKIGAFGYPLGGMVGGTGLKLTTGIVSAPADQTSEGMILLDCRVNPGNSGGPLCDNSGTVVGMVTAKSFSSMMVESYGMALPGQTLCEFLQAKLPAFQPKRTTTGSRTQEWDQIDRRVSPSVLMVLRAAAPPAAASGKPAARSSDRNKPRATRTPSGTSPPVAGRFYCRAKGEFQLYHKGRLISFDDGISPEIELAGGDVIAIRIYSPYVYRALRLAFVSGDRHKYLSFQQQHFSETEDKLPELVTASDIKPSGEGLKIARVDDHLPDKWAALNVPGEEPPWLWGEQKDKWYQYACVIENGMLKEVPEAKADGAGSPTAKEPAASAQEK